jgi:hypothetical protein
MDWADDLAWGLAMNWLQEKRPTSQQMMRELSEQFASELRAAERRGIERAVQALEQPYYTVFIDGRNEHGSHVLPCPGDAVTDHQDIESQLEDQSEGLAEKIISEAEALGHTVGHCVVTIWRHTGGDLDDPGYWEYLRVDQFLTELLCGTAEQQERDHALAAPPADATEAKADDLCEDCPPTGYPTDKTRCIPCPRRAPADAAEPPTG